MDHEAFGMLYSFVTVGQVVRDQQQRGQLAAACNLLSAAGAGPVVPAVAARPHGQPARSIASIIACILALRPILPIRTMSRGATELIGMPLWLRPISLHTPWPARSRRR